VELSKNLMAAHWLVENPTVAFAQDIFTSYSQDQGQTWSKPVKPYSGGDAAEYGFANLYGCAKKSGDDYGLVWLDGRNSSISSSIHSQHDVKGVPLRSTTVQRDNSFSPEQVIDLLACDCCPTSISHSPHGPIVVFRNRDETERRDIFYSRYIAGEWSEAQSVGFDDWHIAGCPVNGPAIASNKSTIAIAWFTAAGGRKKIQLAYSIDGGLTFGAPIEIDHGDFLGRVDLTVNDKKNITISWLGRSSDKVFLEIRMRSYALDGLEIRQISEARLSSDRVNLSGIPKIASIGEDSMMLVGTFDSGKRSILKVYTWFY
jgi:hypothetical protein